MKINAKEIFLKQRRFDLIFKYLYVKNQNDYNREAYAENIRAFNGGHEINPSDGIPKESIDDFIHSFDTLIDDISHNQFNQAKGEIPIQRNGDISDGAHRLAICAALGYDVVTRQAEEWRDDVFAYDFFRKRRMNPKIMDYGALEYVKLNPNAHIVNLHAITNPAQDEQVLEILEKYGFVYYMKEVKLSLNGYGNLKKISYGAFWNREPWIGDAFNGFAGAAAHARQSYGNYPCRVFVFVCDDMESIAKAKAEIRALYNIGNYSVHINDTHEEAIWLAEAYFNENSLFWANNSPMQYEDKRFDENIEHFKNVLRKGNAAIDDYCAVGSTPLNAFGVRHSNDIDYLTVSACKPKDKVVSPHDDQLVYYSKDAADIINNPINYFYYHGIKVYALPLAFKMKIKRGEKKDIKDCARMLVLWIKTWRLSIQGWSEKFKNSLKTKKWVTSPYLTIKRIIKQRG